MSPARLFAFLLAFASCSPTRTARVPARTEAPRTSPSDLLPSDLDFVIRIDAERLREHPLMMGLAKGGDVYLHDTLLVGDASGVVRLILPEIQRARSIFLGGRLTADGYRGDGVIAVEQGAGDPPHRTFADDPALSRLPTTSRRVELYERASAARDEASLYVVMAPPRGLLSFAGRLRPGDKPPLPAGALSLREAGVGLVRYAGSIEADDVLRIEAELVYGSEKQATVAAAVVRKVLDRVALLGPEFGSLSDSARLAPVGPVVGLRLSVPFALIARLH